METEKLIISISSPHSSDYNDYVDRSAAHEVSFAFNRLKIDENESNKQQSIPESDETDENESRKQRLTPESPENDENESRKQRLTPESPENDENKSRKQQLTPESPENDEEDEEEEEDFTFMCIGGENDSPTSEVFEGGQIRQVFPLFDQSLLSGGDSDGEGGRGRLRLPIHVPVDNVFIESPRRSQSSTSSGGKSTAGAAAAAATTTLCALPKESETGAPEINMKSNSTGFSKLWRFRDKMNRSNSDGRDAFVFLEPSHTTTTTTTSKTTSSSSISIGKANAGDDLDSPAKVNGGGKAKVVKKGVIKAKKLTTASAHEVYLKQRGGQTEEERRRSYLPYRPGLMGFFTNVNGGLSKNVHPF